jgi:hypothetical protein
LWHVCSRFGVSTVLFATTQKKQLAIHFSWIAPGMPRQNGITECVNKLLEWNCNASICLGCKRRLRQKTYRRALHRLEGRK